VPSQTPSLNNKIYVIQAVVNAFNCPLGIQLYSFGEVADGPSAVGNLNCVQNSVKVLDLSIDSIPSGNAISGVIVFADPASKIYTSVFTINPQNGTAIFNQGLNLIPKVLDVGNQPSVSLATIKNETWIVEVHNNGFCWNNEPDNKRADPGVCDSVPTPSQYILTYNFGRFSDWTTQIINNTAPIFSACHPTILHGTYDTGSFPDVKLFSYENSLNLVEVHAAAPNHTYTVCGISSFKNGLVLDAWPLPT